MRFTSAFSIILACCLAWLPAGASAQSWDDNDDDDAVIWGYILAAALTVAVGTSPIWIPVAATDEVYTHADPTGFQDYPYKDGRSTGFVVIGDDGSRGIAVFTDLGISVLDDNNGLSISTELLTEKRIGLYFNQAHYQVDALEDADRGASSLHATYLFARHENWVFSIGLGGRYEHLPVGETNLSGLYSVDWFPARPVKLSAKYEYDGKSHFRIAGSLMLKRAGIGIALRSESIDNERYQTPEVFVGVQL